MFKVFSAKYFPSGNIFDSNVHPQCSHAWRSILQACDVINKGAIWRGLFGELGMEVKLMFGVISGYPL